MPHVYIVFRTGPDVMADPYWGSAVTEYSSGMPRQLMEHSRGVVLDTIESSGVPPTVYAVSSLTGGRHLSPDIKTFSHDPNSKEYENIQAFLDENTEYR